MRIGTSNFYCLEGNTKNGYHVMNINTYLEWPRHLLQIYLADNQI
jgi:hypothetical protein